VHATAPLSKHAQGRPTMFYIPLVRLIEFSASITRTCTLHMICTTYVQMYEHTKSIGGGDCMATGSTGTTDTLNS